MKKFVVAFDGLKKAFKHKAVKIQGVLGILAIVGGLMIRLDVYEWLAFVVSIGLVIAMEVMNTAIEYLCNYIKNDYDEKIGFIKDLSSGAVLVSALMAFVIMLICLLRRILG